MTDNFTVNKGVHETSVYKGGEVKNESITLKIESLTMTYNKVSRMKGNICDVNDVEIGTFTYQTKEYKSDMHAMNERDTFNINMYNKDNFTATGEANNLVLASIAKIETEYQTINQ